MWPKFYALGTARAGTRLLTCLMLWNCIRESATTFNFFQTNLNGKCYSHKQPLSKATGRYDPVATVSGSNAQQRCNNVCYVTFGSCDRHVKTRHKGGVVFSPRPCCCFWKDYAVGMENALPIVIPRHKGDTKVFQKQNAKGKYSKLQHMKWRALHNVEFQ
jgi:hypothetical protein